MAKITVELDYKEAEAFGFFLKGVTFHDYRDKARDNDGAYLMQRAGERIREALGEEGVDVR
ncbi:MAG: hypothetical protein D3903_00815 [Candidatus Electrothrix sp. GM3_4]|nr:hypothetical protein [Candidatus Electrothrix sp. GM3_4]